MTKPIGRIWVNGTCISGYIVVGQNICVKFAAEKNFGSNWVYPSKKDEKTEVKFNSVFELLEAGAEKALAAYSKLLKGGKR